MKPSKKTIVMILFVGGIILIVWMWSILLFPSGGSGESQDTEQDGTEGLSANILQDSAESEESDSGAGDTQDSDSSGDSQTSGNSQGASNSDTNDDSNQQDASRTRPLRILFPPWYPETMIEQLIATVEADSGIEAVGNRLPTWEAYQRLAVRYLTQGGGIDLIVVPSIRWDDLQDRGAHVDLSRDSSRFFHAGFHDYLYTDDDQASIIPFGIDPVVLYTNNTITQQGDLSSSSKILQYIARIQSENNLQENQTSIVPVAQYLTVPRIIGQDNDTQHSDRNQYGLLEETMSLGALIDYSLSNSSTDRLLMMINRTLQLPTIESLLDGKTQESPDNCTNALAVCLVIDNHAGIAFGLLSTAQHFSRTIINSDTIQLRDIPFGNAQDYPVLGRGVVINKSSSQKETARQRVDSFIKLSIETQTIPYPRYLFGPTYATIQRQAVNTNLQALNSFKQQQTFVTGTIDAPQGYETVGDLIKHPSLRELLDGTIDHRTYLQTVYNLLQ